MSMELPLLNSLAVKPGVKVHHHYFFVLLSSPEAGSCVGKAHRSTRAYIYMDYFLPANLHPASPALRRQLPSSLCAPCPGTASSLFHSHSHSLTCERGEQQWTTINLVFPERRWLSAMSHPQGNSRECSASPAASQGMKVGSVFRSHILPLPGKRGNRVRGL